MDELNKYLPLWQKAEKSPQPRYIRQVKIINFTDFEKEVYGQSDSFVHELVNSLYAGDTYILRNAFPPSFIHRIKKDIFLWWMQEKPLFHKMVEGVPDHHRIYDKESIGKYGFDSIRHANFFFQFNNDPFKVFGEVNKMWRVVKFLGGFSKNEYEKNRPKDGIIDRLQFTHYPAGAGKMEMHSDPYLNQRVFANGAMSKRGLEYQKGGLYILNVFHQKVDLEPILEVGDLCIAYPTLYHGVALIDEECTPDWNSPKGRWFLGLYSNDSDHVKERHTSYGVKIEIKTEASIIPQPIFL